MRRRHDSSGTPDGGRVTPPRDAHRAATPWVTVAAGAGAVTLVVAVAGMVGAATGGGEAVVVGASADAGNAVEDGVPAVTPRPDAPRPEVTRIPPPDHAHDPADGADPATTPAPRPSPGGTGTPPTVADPGPAPTTEPSAAPGTAAPEPTPTTPAPTADPASVTWVQERLRVHGADVAVTGTLDDATRAALRAFQQAHGLPGDGAVTAATAEALAAAPAGGGEAPTDPGGTAPTEPAPPSPTDKPSAGVPGATIPSTGGQAESTLAPSS